jgi:hypothetical protein
MSSCFFNQFENFWPFPKYHGQKYIIRLSGGLFLSGGQGNQSYQYYRYSQIVFLSKWNFTFNTLGAERR